jgi:hypothetical protein
LPILFNSIDQLSSRRLSAVSEQRSACLTHFSLLTRCVTSCSVYVSFTFYFLPTDDLPGVRDVAAGWYVCRERAACWSFNSSAVVFGNIVTLCLIGGGVIVVPKE